MCPCASHLTVPFLGGSAAKGLTMDDFKLQRVCSNEGPTCKAKFHQVHGDLSSD